MRMKIIGSIFGIAAVWCMQITARIELSAVDAAGRSITQVAAGTSFTLKVKASGITSGSEPIIHGIERLQLLGNKSVMNFNFNGNTSTQHSYTVRIDEPGSYTVGPASIAAGGTVENSNILQLQVTRDAGAHQEKRAKQPLLQLLQQSKKVVVGQRMPISVRFLYTEEDIKLSTIQKPSFAHFDVDKEQGPFKGETVVRGTTYQYVEWRFSLYAQEAGSFTVEPFRAEYTIPSDDHNMVSMLAMLVGGGYDTHRISSNSITFDVQPLPASAEDVKAVGEYRLFTASVDSPVVQQGNAMVLTLSLHGSGNAERIPAPTLTLPDGFVAHYSKSYWADGAQQQVRKFEYVVQGLKDGKAEIPAQTFTYFDLRTQHYATLESGPIALAILPRSKKQELPQTAPEQSPAEESVEEKKVEHLAPINIHGALHARHHRVIPWWVLFWVMTGPLIFYGAFVLFKQRLQWYRTKSMVTKADVRKKLELMALGQASQPLYPLIINFIADQCGLETAITSEDIEGVLMVRGMNEAELAEWRLFFDQVMERHFSAHTVVDHNLIRQAHAWIDRLEKLL